MVKMNGPKAGEHDEQNDESEGDGIIDGDNDWVWVVVMLLIIMMMMIFAVTMMPSNIIISNIAIFVVVIILSLHHRSYSYRVGDDEDVDGEEDYNVTIR